VLIAERDMVVHEVADRLDPAPAHGSMTEQIPRHLGQFLGVVNADRSGTPLHRTHRRPETSGPPPQTRSSQSSREGRQIRLEFRLRRRGAHEQPTRPPGEGQILDRRSMETYRRLFPGATPATQAAN
jgi:hypothetical protein